MPRRNKRASTQLPEQGQVQELPPNEDGGSQHEVGKGSMPCSKKARGSKKLPDIWKQPPNGKKPVQANKAKQPVGKWAYKFVQFCGVIARNPRILPFSYENWTNVPNTTKATAYDTLKQYFDYPDCLDNWVEKSIAEKWRDYKYELKATFFDEHRSEADNARVVPPDVERADWQYLVHYWFSNTRNRRSAIGVPSRAQQVVLHTAETNNFGVVQDNLVRAKFDELCSTASSSDPVTLQRQVIMDTGGPECHGGVREMGLGPTPTQVCSPRASTSSWSRNDEISELKAQMAHLQNMMTTLLRHQSLNPDNLLSLQDGQRAPSNLSRATLGQDEDIGSNSVKRMRHTQ